MLFSIEERVKYYTANLNTKYEFKFDESQEIIYYNKDNKECTYTDQGGQAYTLCCIHKNFSFDKYHKVFWDIKRNFKGRYYIPDDNPYKSAILNEYNEVKYNYNINSYIKPIIDLVNSDIYFKDKAFIVRPGDMIFNSTIPLISKTRPSVDNLDKVNNVIINLDQDRHWNSPIKVVDEHDISFTKKNNKLIWRGSITGFFHHPTRPSRLKLCETYINHPNRMIDIGFCTPYLSTNNINLGKEGITIGNMLKSKFLVSTEGGDVATNLKWIMYSNSVPLMPKPTMVSWFMEDKLIPWTHYIPLKDDFSDLEEKYNWCLKNIDKCEIIAINGKKYVEQFLDKEREKIITNLVLKKYADFVKIKTVWELKEDDNIS